MGYREILLELPTDYTEDQLRSKIENELKTKEFSYQIKEKPRCQKEDQYPLANFNFSIFRAD